MFVRLKKKVERFLSRPNIKFQAEQNTQLEFSKLIVQNLLFFLEIIILPISLVPIR